MMEEKRSQISGGNLNQTGRELFLPSMTQLSIPETLYGAQVPSAVFLEARATATDTKAFLSS